MTTAPAMAAIADQYEKVYGELTVSQWLRQMRDEAHTRNQQKIRDLWSGLKDKQKKALIVLAGVYVEPGEEVRYRSWETIPQPHKAELFKALTAHFTDSVRDLRAALLHVYTYHTEEKARQGAVAALTTQATPPPEPLRAAS